MMMTSLHRSILMYLYNWKFNDVAIASASSYPNEQRYCRECADPLNGQLLLENDSGCTRMRSFTSVAI